MKQKDVDSEVTMPCHFGVRQRLQNLANVHNPSKAHSDRLPSCLKFCPWSLTMVMYAPCVHKVYSAQPCLGCTLWEVIRPINFYTRHYAYVQANKIFKTKVSNS